MEIDYYKVLIIYYYSNLTAEDSRLYKKFFFKWKLQLLVQNGLDYVLLQLSYSLIISNTKISLLLN